MAGETALTFAASLMFWQAAHPVLYGMGAGLAVGIGKELADRRQRGNKFSAADLVADGIGIALGASGAQVVLTHQSLQLRVEF